MATFDLTNSNIVLMVGRHIYILLLGILAITFGKKAEWPKASIEEMIQASPKKNPPA
jgi:hypothetical protein